MWNYIKDLNKSEKITVFFTTHYLEEAEKVADKIAITDHGVIVANGNVEELKKQTGKSSLEDAFLALTGKAIREETVSARDNMRVRARMFGRR